MITINEKDHVTLIVDDNNWDLEDINGYKQFLLWITSPDEKTVISDEAFEPDGQIDSKLLLKVLRYQAFLVSFSKRRKTIISNHKENNTSLDSSLASIQSFIDSLSEDE